MDESAGLPKKEKGDAKSNETRFIPLSRFRNSGKAAYGPGHLLLAFGQFTLYAPSVFLSDSKLIALNLFFSFFAIVVDEAGESGHGAGVDVEAEGAVAAALAAQEASRRADFVESAAGSARDLALLDPDAAVIELDHEELHLLFL